MCKEGDAAATCLTKPEADAIRKIWDGPKTASGDRLWFGLERGAPLGALAGGSPFPIASTHVQYWTHQDAKFDWRTITEAQFEQEFRTSAQKFHDLIGTDQADLERFRAHAGKMIIWHGEADQLIFPRGTINYFNRLVEANGGAVETAKFARLYMAPGVGHCGGGVGPMPTGLLESVVNWVEKGVAPTTIVAASATSGARGGVPGAGVARTRPLCPYPTTAKWNGTGSTDDAANFACVSSNPRVADYTIR